MVSPPYLCQVGDRVVFHNKQGIPHYGSVQWIGEKEKVPYNLVGIKTVSIIKHSIATPFKFSGSKFIDSILL